MPVCRMGVFNFVTGPGSTLGQALIESPEVDGVTFTGSFDVGMKIFRDFANGRGCARPSWSWAARTRRSSPAMPTWSVPPSASCARLLACRGRNARPARGCIIEAPVYDELVASLVELTNKLTIGDPTERKVYLGPVVNKSSYQDYQDFCEELSQIGHILTGGKVLTDGDIAKGYFCPPTLVADLPLEHRLWKHEMFLPITTIAKVKNLDEAMQWPINVELRPDRRFLRRKEETEWFFDHIEAGVPMPTARRAQPPAPGLVSSPLAAGKAPAPRGKNAGGHYYLPLYMHEQIQTVVR